MLNIRKFHGNTVATVLNVNDITVTVNSIGDRVHGIVLRTDKGSVLKEISKELYDLLIKELLNQEGTKKEADVE